MNLNRCMGCMGPFRGYPCPGCGYDISRKNEMSYALPAETILVGKYLIGKVLGQGGFGITYIGWNLTLERKVAIKEYFPMGQVSRVPGRTELAWYATESARQARQDGMQMFLKEARKMSKIDGIPGIVRVRDLFQENDTAYIVMDFVEGETLKDRLVKTGPMPWEQAKKIFLPVIRTMERVHQAGLIHRDLSPDNLMLAPDGSVHILDLGAAKDLNINSGASSMKVAKNGFSPLEQYGLQGGSGHYTDVYALAATIYYALTGEVPPSALDRVNKDELDWNLPVLKTVPDSVLRALKEALALRPEERIRSMADFYTRIAEEAPGKENVQTKNVLSKSVLISICAVAALCLLIGIAAALSAKLTKPEHVTSKLDSTTANTTSVLLSDAGSGTESDPYRLTSAADLKLLREHPNACFLLTRDISMAGMEYTPVPSFSGTLDGGGHWIKELNLVYEEETTISGLFGTIEKTGIVRDLCLEVRMNAETPAKSVSHGISGLAEENKGLISKCTVQSRLVNGGNYSPITASNDGTIEYCDTNTVSIGCLHVNGLVDGNDGTLSGNSAKLETTGGDVFGITYRNWNTIENCTVEVQAKECRSFCGISTQNYSPIKNCSVTGTVAMGSDAIACYAACSMPGDGSEIVGGNYHVIDSKTCKIIPIIPDNSKEIEETTTPTQATTASTEPGSGTESDPYRIYSAGDLELMRTYSNAYFCLERDVDLSGSTFKPISTFYGVLDGNGYELSGLNYEFVKGANAEVAALFTSVEEGGAVRNLKLSCSMDAGDLETTDAAGIAIRNGGVIENCNVTVQAANCKALGGIARNNSTSGRVKNCTVTLMAKNCKFVGGIIEFQAGRVENCSAYMQISEVTSMGGIAYANKGTIQSCTANGSVQTSHTNGILASAVGENMSSGFISDSDGTVTDDTTGKTLPGVGHQA